MNVTLVCQGFECSSLNLQPWRRVYEISKRISSQGFSVTIITDRPPEKLEEKIGKIRVVQFTGLTLAPFFKKKKLLSAILETTPHIVVWYGSPFSSLYLKNFKSLRKPLILDIDTDLYSLNHLSRIPLRILLNPSNNLFHHLATALFSNYITRITANSNVIDKIIVPNEHIKNKLYQRGVPQNKIAIVPSTIDVTELGNYSNDTLETKQKLGMKNSDFIISYFGAPTSIRGPDVAVLAMQQVMRRDNNVKMLIFSRRALKSDSSGEEYNKTEEQFLTRLIRQLNLRDRVRVISGYAERSEIKAYFHVSDVILLPFRLVPSEPPLSIFEAMSAGKAVIATDLGGLSEIIGKDRGLLVQPGDANELAQAILFLAKNPETLKALGKNAQLFAAALPNWEEVVQRFEKVLEGTVNQSLKN